MFPLWLLGALLSIVGSTFSNLGVNIQKFAAMKEEERQGEYRSYFCQPLWVVGFGFVFFGSLFDFAALAFAAQSIVATVGSVTLVANLFFASMWLGETLTKRDVYGTGLILLGSAVAVAFGDQSDEEYTISDLQSQYVAPVFVVYIISSGGVAVLLFLLVKRAEPIRERMIELKKEHHERHSLHDLNEVLAKEKEIDVLYLEYRLYEKIHPLAYCALAGFFGSLVLIFAKSTAVLIRTSIEGENQFAKPLTYVFIFGMLACIVSETHFLATGLKFFDALYIVPVFQCFFITLGATAGGIFFGEFARMSFLSAVLFPIGVCITISGVYLLSSREMGYTEEREAMGQGYIAERKRTESVLAKAEQGMENGEEVCLGGAEEEEDIELAVIAEGTEASTQREEAKDAIMALPQTTTVGTGRDHHVVAHPRGRRRARRSIHNMDGFMFSGGSIILTQVMHKLVDTTKFQEQRLAESRFSRARSRSQIIGRGNGVSFKGRTAHTGGPRSVQTQPSLASPSSSAGPSAVPSSVSAPANMGPLNIKTATVLQRALPANRSPKKKPGGHHRDRSASAMV